MTKKSRKSDLKMAQNDCVLRLKRAHGHLSKVTEMLKEQRPCGEVLQQLSAVIAALGTTRNQILKTHINSCLKPALKPNKEELLAEIEAVLQSAIKT